MPLSVIIFRSLSAISFEPFRACTHNPIIAENLIILKGKIFYSAFQKRVLSLAICEENEFRECFYGTL